MNMNKSVDKKVFDQRNFVAKTVAKNRRREAKSICLCCCEWNELNKEKVSNRNGALFVNLKTKKNIYIFLEEIFEMTRECSRSLF